MAPGDLGEVDFTEVRSGCCEYKYLFMFAAAFSGWTEAFPTKRETAQVVF